MPDAGKFDREPRGVPHWGDVFAALPQEIPDSGAWQRVHARLPAPAPRAAPVWWAAAAVLMLALAIAAPPSLRKTPPAAIAGTVSPAATADAAPAPPASPIDAPTISPAPTTTAATVTTTAAVPRGHPRPARQPMGSPRPEPRHAGAEGAVRTAATASSASSAMESLYAQSAQLEGLIAIARDDRVASGTSAALTDALDARIALIDATLAQPRLSDATRRQLWNERVDALQQLVGIEVTRRLYAARGERYDAALVSID